MSRLSSLFRWNAGGLFLTTVALPTVAAAVYFGLLASNLYVSESRFVVRSAERVEAPTLGALVKGGGLSASADNAYAVHDYILSRDALASLQKTTGLKQAYASRQVDALNRFPGFLEDDNFETLFDYYKKYVSVLVDPVSSVSVLTVRAFDSDLAVKMNKELLARAEALVNALNKRMQQDLLAAARTEVAAAEERMRGAEADLAKFRGSRNVVDPERQAVMQLQYSDRLREALLTAETRLEQAQAAAAHGPQVPALQRQVDKIRRAIREAEGRTTGGDERSLVGDASKYQQLALERELAAKHLAVTLDRLDRAQTEATHKQVYLERVAEPSHPDGSLEPRRLRAVLATFFVGLLVWGVAAVLVAGIREHREVL